MSDQPQDQLSVLKLVTGRLDAARIPYMITGSIAGGHYGHPRMTRDIDVVVQVEPTDADRLAAAMGDEFGADTEVIRAAISRRSLFNLIHREAVVKVDFVIRKDTAYRIEEFERRRLVDVDGHPLWMVTPEDLILSKLVWARDSRSELQLRDVRAVLTFQHATLDRWAAILSVDDLLRGGSFVNDTSPDITAQFDALMAQRSGSDRVRMMCEMFDLARKLAAAGIRAEEPGISDSNLRARLFERFYGGDYSERERARIVATLR